jgi:hypothetical protein
MRDTGSHGPDALAQHRHLILLPWLVLSLSCQGCEEPRARAPAAEGAAREEGGTLPIVKLAAPPEGLQLGPADRSLLQFAGEMDVKNLHASTVMVAFTEQMEEPSCSGVLIGPRLVLTAGSCVCNAREVAEAGVGTRTVIDAAACEPRAFVTTVINGAVRDMRFKENTTEMEFRTYQGAVRPHPQLRVVLNERGDAVSAHADLAVILLDEAIDDELREARLAHAEPQVGEVLVMAGYAHDEKKRGFGGVYGARYSRKNRVTRAVREGRGFYRQQGAYLFDGFAGGPCLREDTEGEWLVGIAGKGSSEELPFTSTSFFRDWLRSEIRRAAKE